MKRILLRFSLFHHGLPYAQRFNSKTAYQLEELPRELNML
jgi:hypothetical protein